MSGELCLEVQLHALPACHEAEANLLLWTNILVEFLQFHEL